MENILQYNMYKFYFDEIKYLNNKDEYIKQLESKYDELNKINNLEDYDWEMTDFGEFKMALSKNLLDLKFFENFLDEKAYKHFEDNIKSQKQLIINGIITNDKIILFYNDLYIIKFLFFDKLSGLNQELIQLTADFSKFINGNFDEDNTKKTYKEFKYLLCNNSDYVFNLFKQNNILFLEETRINFGNNFDFIVKNENYRTRNLSHNFKIFDINKLKSDKFRLIGLANVGATCYMNATLQCLINVPQLTKYLLIDTVYKEITENNNKYELSSAYCNLLYHVCCDDNINNYFEPKVFKDVIGWKNPLFKGINANDSKDLINFMLEEMNQELIKLNPNKNQNNNMNMNNQIDQTNKYDVLNSFKSDFSKNNNSIIAKNFFFITESKTKCRGCNIFKYNYQVLYLLEFPLEVVFNYCISNNINVIDNYGKKYISLKQCFKNYMIPTQFVGENQLYCNNCNRLSDAICMNRIYSLPPTLIIILNRGKGKIFDCIVDFPPKINLENYVLCPQSITQYELRGVITHLGESGMSGHFIAFCKHRIDNNWYKYNDAIVTYCDDQNNDYKKGTPYILFYESCGNNKNNVLFDANKVNIISFNNKSNKSFNSFNER